MALAKIKTAEERARLDAIFEEIEKACYSTPDAPVREPEPRKSPEQRLLDLDAKCFVGNVRQGLKDGAFGTKWEMAMAKFITDTYAPMNAELNILRNFATAVDTRLQKAAREQDNHHYFKMFADSVRSLLGRI